jgi:archaellum component FlaC
MAKKDLTPKDREFFMERYNFIYRELNHMQDSMAQIEEATAKLLKELEDLRNKEKEQFKEKDGEI